VRFPEITASVDPDLQLRDVVTAESILKREQGLTRLIGVTVSLVTLSVVVLSATASSRVSSRARLREE